MWQKWNREWLTKYILELWLTCEEKSTWVGDFNIPIARGIISPDLITSVEAVALYPMKPGSVLHRNQTKITRNVWSWQTIRQYHPMGWHWVGPQVWVQPFWFFWLLPRRECRRVEGRLCWHTRWLDSELSTRPWQSKHDRTLVGRSRPPLSWEPSCRSHSQWAGEKDYPPGLDGIWQRGCHSWGCPTERWISGW